MTLLEEILDKLSKLTNDELSIVSEQAKNLLPVRRNPWMEAYEDVTKCKVSALGGASRIFNSCAENAEAYLHSIVKNHQEVYLIHARRVLTKLVVADLKRMGVPVTLKTMSHGLGRLPEIVDSQYGFPGYVASGLGHLIFGGGS